MVAQTKQVVPAVSAREMVTRQESVARHQERRNLGRRQREEIDPMDPVRQLLTSAFVTPGRQDYFPGCCSFAAQDYSSRCLGSLCYPPFLVLKKGLARLIQAPAGFSSAGSALITCSQVAMFPSTAGLCSPPILTPPEGAGAAASKGHSPERLTPQPQGRYSSSGHTQRLAPCCEPIRSR